MGGGNQMAKIMGNEQIIELFTTLIEKVETQDRLIETLPEKKKQYKKLLEDVKNLNEVNLYKVKNVVGM
jgi:restriction endonuclease S subunit